MSVKIFGGLLPPYRLTALPPSLLIAILVAGACARIEPPPGGPPDNLPPRLITIRPDSLAVYPNFDGEVEFRFDEVISEGGQASMGLGTSDLERLVILSPTHEIPKVSWKRSAIAVAPREGWQKNRVYRVELLRGVMDLRRNQLDSGAVITFSTGAPLPDSRISGTVVDWTAGRLAQGALIEAILLPDSLPYRGMTDSSGSFDLGPIPRGQYLLFGVLDQNRNFRREFREAWDSLRVGGDTTTPLILWTAVRDTVGPRITTVTPVDSTGAELTFNQPVNPYQTFDSTNIRVITAAADSAPVPVTSLLPKALDDSVQQTRRLAADTVKPDTTQADSARAAALERLKQGPGRIQDSIVTSILKRRPPLSDRLVVRVGQILRPGSRYVVEVFGIRNVNGFAGDSRQLLVVPEPPAAPADSLQPPPDSTAKDSIPPPPPRPR